MKNRQETKNSLENYILIVIIASIMVYSIGYRIGKDMALQKNREEKTSLQYNKQ